MNFDRRRFVAAMAASTALAGLPACSTINPATGRSSFTGFYSVEDDIKLGRKEHPNLVKEFGGAYDNARLQRYVDQVGKTLAHGAEYKQFPYTFTLLNTPIVNAFALPGGYVYISRGLLALAGNEAEMAGVLAHELGHVNARHTAERLSRGQLAQLGVLAGVLGAAALGLPKEMAQIGQSIAMVSIQSFSRKQEFEADTLGVRYMSRAGYEPEALVTFLRTLREQSIIEAKMRGLPPGKVDEFNMMSTHPRTVDRVKAAMQAAATARPKAPRVGRKTYLGRIDGMLFGDDPKQGIVKGRLFQHPAMRFQFRVPKGFRINNGQDAITAQEKTGAAIRFDIAPVKGSGDLAAYLQNEWTPKTRLRDVERIKINGMDAATGWVRGKDGQGRVIELRGVAIRRNAKSVYRFLFVNPAKESARLAPAFRKTTHSFRRLSRAEAAKIKPLRLLLVPARRGDTVRRLARTLPYGKYNESWFRVLNDMKAGEEVRPNRRLKVVAA
ncbi:MAG: M48 family metalloprotease [Alphaproteobacteria bacterium]|nr:M48 family metalloprotease [Alphaproteobacteria bacterium]